MAHQILEEFYPLILNDSTIQDQLKGATDQASFTQQLVKLGVSKGYNFTAQDVESAIYEGQQTSLQTLSEEDLAIVAGGRPPASDGHCGDLWTTLFGPC
jgi:predicted ribosomally synthesized peptide with nif11-like leader